MSIDAPTNSTKTKRVFVDMSATLLHHGHIRLLEKAKALGHVVVALTTDEEIEKHKGYKPELDYEARRELLLALRFVDEVIPSPWSLTDEFLKEHKADLLVHSGPNFNACSNVVSLERTEGVCSSDMREAGLASIVQKRNSEKVLLTPGPTNLHASNLLDLRPVFTRNDGEFEAIERRVLERVRLLAGQDSIVALQGSATTAIEVATSNFLTGDVVVVVSGFYSERMHQMIERKRERLGLRSLTAVAYADVLNGGQLPQADWVVASLTETGIAFLSDIELLRAFADKCKAKLMLDATGSINLEQGHELAHVCMFSSCKGLGGLTGGSFITFNQDCLNRLNPEPREFMLDIHTFIEHKTTAPAHAICSLDSISERFHELGNRVRQSKQVFLDKFSAYVAHKGNQPALCTKLKGVRIQAPPFVQLYHPRAAEPNSAVVCHLFDQFPSNRAVGEAYGFLEIEPA